MNHLVDIIIPTFNNPQYLQPCLQSLLHVATTANFVHITVVNNGDALSTAYIPSDHPSITVIQADKNLGWEGGLKLGVEKTSAPFVLFLNDDTHFTNASIHWLHYMLNHMVDPTVGAIGPTSNVVMGRQSIFFLSPFSSEVVPYLIGFCMLVRREALEKVGGIDDTLPGGDDIDLSIRLRKAGYRLLIKRESFVFHHGFKTGERVKGTADKTEGWNSVQMTERTNLALIRKHGFRSWYETLMKWDSGTSAYKSLEEPEGDKVRNLIKGEKVLELGVGGTKTIPSAVGVDMFAKGTFIGSISNTKNPISVADIVADVSGPLPFEDNEWDTIIARHILEHVMNPLEVLIEWGRILKSGGRLIIAVPDHEFRNSIPLNVEHVHAFTKHSLPTFIKSAGLKVESVQDSGNNVSFILVATK